jgi:hypothetical protein
MDAGYLLDGVDDIESTDGQVMPAEPAVATL